MKNTSGSSRFDVLLKHLFGGSERFRQNFVKIASATVLAQILGLLSLPILSRLFSSTDFGILTTYMMVQGISLALVTGRVDWLIPNVKRKRHAQRLISMGVMISLVMVVVIAAIFMGFEAHILAHLHLEEHALILWLVPLGLIAGSLQLLFQSWYVFRGNLGTVGWSKLAQAVVTLVLSLIFGVLALTGNGLVIAYIAGFFAAAFVLIRKNPEALPSFTFKKMKIYSKLLRIYFLQLLSLTGLSLTNIAMTMSLTFLILTFYGTQVLGWYGLVFRIATAPIGLITTALVQSFWTDAAILAKSNPVQLRQFYIKTLARLSMLSIPLGILFLCGPLYIPF
ncbi:MAG TPA: hypothetical protein ENJ46_04960, partial [Hellea balneolensis]|nr:hypothetical protein [Hellea balneolensis]